jgi:hypothetical protein
MAGPCPKAHLLFPDCQRPAQNRRNEAFLTQKRRQILFFNSELRFVVLSTNLAQAVKSRTGIAT